MLERVAKKNAGLLDEGESYVAAAAVAARTVGATAIGGIVGRAIAIENRDHPEGVELPEDMVWAVSPNRLFVWVADRLTTNKPRKLVGIFALGSAVQLVELREKDRRAGISKASLFVKIRGVDVAVHGKRRDVVEVGRCIPSAPPS